MVRTGRNVYATQFHPEANGETFATRIRIYNGYGYFEPADAEALTAGGAGRRHHRARTDPRPFRHALRLNPERRVNP
jgi:GMP synthase-like glutamine amidotransferase